MTRYVSTDLARHLQTRYVTSSLSLGRDRVDGSCNADDKNEYDREDRHDDLSMYACEV